MVCFEYPLWGQRRGVRWRACTAWAVQKFLSAPVAFGNASRGAANLVARHLSIYLSACLYVCLSLEKLQLSIKNKTMQYEIMLFSYESGDAPQWDQWEEKWTTGPFHALTVIISNNSTEFILILILSPFVCVHFLWVKCCIWADGGTLVIAILSSEWDHRATQNPFSGWQ